MPIKDLLWACPVCHAIEGLDPAGKCRGCGARFRRGRGARIVLDRAGAPRDERAPSDWLQCLPWPDLDGEGLALPPGVEPPFRELVQLRAEQGRVPVRLAGDYLGRVEVLGPPQAGMLTLDPKRLAFEPAERSGVVWSAPLEELAAVQPASSTVQIRAQGRPLVSIRFQDGSVRLWEQRIKHLVRNAWRAAGRGAIVEFQPRIRNR